MSGVCQRQRRQRHDRALGTTADRREGGCVPVVTGGVLDEWGPPKAALLALQQQIRDFAGRTTAGQYVVDIGFRTWHNFRGPDEPYGVKPGTVGRTQRRFIVWHSVPKGLASTHELRTWLSWLCPRLNGWCVTTCRPSPSPIQPATWRPRWQHCGSTWPRSADVRPRLPWSRGGRDIRSVGPQRGLCARIAT